MGGDNNYRHIKGNLLQGKKKMTNFKRRPLLFMNTAHITEVKLLGRHHVRNVTEVLEIRGYCPIFECLRGIT